MAKKIQKLNRSHGRYYSARKDMTATILRSSLTTLLGLLLEEIIDELFVMQLHVVGVLPPYFCCRRTAGASSGGNRGQYDMKINSHVTKNRLCGKSCVGTCKIALTIIEDTGKQSPVKILRVCFSSSLE